MLNKKVFYRKLLGIGLPTIIQYTLSNFVGFIDNLMIGQFGSLMISAVSIVNQIFFVYNCTDIGIIAGAGIFSTQYFGKGDYIGVRKVFHIKWLISIIFIFIGFVVITLFGDNIIQLYMTSSSASDKKELMRLTHEYLPYILLSTIPCGLRNIYASMICEYGNTKPSMIASIVATLSNVCMNYAFIYGYFGCSAMGIKGAALATLLSRILECTIVLFAFHKCSFAKKIYSNINVDRQLCRKISTSILPLAINDLLFSFSFIVGSQIYALQSMANVSIMSIVTTIALFFIDIPVATGQAAEIIIGHELGKNNLSLAKVLAIKMINIALVIGVVLGIIVYLISPYAPALYKIDDNMREIVIKCIKIFAVTFPLESLSHIIFFTLRSGGKTLLIAICDSIFTWLIFLPVQYILIKTTSLKLDMVYLIVLLLYIIKCGAGYIVIRNGIWAKNVTNSQD